MLWSALASRAVWSIVLYMVFVVFNVVLLCLRMSFRRLVWRSGSLFLVVVLSGLGLWVVGHARRPPMGGSASVNVMCGRTSPSTTPRAPASAASLVVSDSRVGFDFTYMDCEALLVSFLYMVVGFHKDIAVRVVFVV